MDAIDRKILHCLKENARMNASDIGGRVNMSVSAVIERIRKLESAGIIQQYTAIIDPEKIHRSLGAFISVSLEHPKYNDSFAACLLENSQIIECHYITGDFDYMLRVATDSTNSLERILNEIKSIKGVSLTKTLVVLSTIKDEYSAFPDEDNEEAPKRKNR